MAFGTVRELRREIATRQGRDVAKTKKKNEDQHLSTVLEGWTGHLSASRYLEIEFCVQNRAKTR